MRLRLRDRFARQTEVPGFAHQRVARLRLGLLPGPATRQVLGALARQAAALGVQQQLHATGAASAGVPGAIEALRLNPEIRLWVVSPTRLLEHLRAVPGDASTFIVADVDAHDAAGLADAPSDWGVWWVATTTRAVITGRDRRRVAETARALGLASGDPGGEGGAHDLLASACLLADAVAHAGAFVGSQGHMPIDGGVRIYTAAEPGTVVPRPRSMLLVGAGGALSHAFLEAVLADAVLRRAVGRLYLIDPDAFELSNASRQTLMGGIANLFRAKADVTAREIARRWPTSEPCPELVPVVAPIQAEHLRRHAPDVTALFADAFAPRALAYQAVRGLGGDRLVICGGTEFSHGQVRAWHLASDSACFDHGPEGLAAAAAAEPAAPASCGAVAAPANVLTNALVGALGALQLRSHLLHGTKSFRQNRVNWLLPQRWTNGPLWPACRCGAEAA